MAVELRLFAGARDAAGAARAEFELSSAPTVEALLRAAVARFGPAFAEVLGTARIWLNGEAPAAGAATALADGDEVAVLPPVSGGATR